MAGEPEKSGELYATLCGRVEDALVHRLFEHIAKAVNDRVKRLHLLIQSTGGVIGDGIAIYNYLKHMPIEVIAYNCGMVQSIAVVAFLGAARRKACKTATFMVHKATFNPGRPATSFQLSAATQSLAVDDGRIEGILREYLTMPEEKWTLHKYADLFITADEALEFGLIDEIGDFVPPAGGTLINI